MISILKFREALLTRTRTATTGGFKSDSLLEIIDESQKFAVKILSQYYEDNQSIKDALRYLVTREGITLNEDGSLPFEEDYVMFAGVLGVNGKPAYPVNVNEVAILKDSVIRNPSVEKGRFYYSQSDNEIQFYPEEQLDVDYQYIRMPIRPKFVATPVSSADRDYEEISTAPGDIVDLEWPEEQFNYLLCLCLQKMGVEIRDELQIQYANMGLSMDQINIQPK